MFHGNGGNLGHRLPLAQIFVMKMRCNVLLMSYRGCVFIVVNFTSIPTLNFLKAMVVQEVLLRRKVRAYNLSSMPYLTSYQGLRIDAQTGLDYLTSHPLFKDTPIVSAVPFHLAFCWSYTTVHIGSIRAINGRCGLNRPR
jgi:hypothetical protein